MATVKPPCNKIECPICSEVYTDPRVLPCGHTFSRPCIETFTISACPLCRKEFTLSRNGVDDLPKNLALLAFSQSQELWSGCEICSGGSEAAEVKVATVYCVECQQKLCQACEEDHRKFNVTRRHKIVELDNSSAAVKLARVIPSTAGDRGVSAVASVGDEVFVLRSPSQHVEVYDAGTFELQRRVTVSGLSDSCWGLAACAHYKCLYVSDGDHNSVHRTDLSGSSAEMKWPVARDPRGLSVNKTHNVVVACCGANSIQEFTTHGALVREISLQADVSWPWHAVQLSTGDYVVSQSRSPGEVSIVRVDKQAVCSYVQLQTSDVGRMRYPMSLAVTRNDFILVADSLNDRILSVDSSLSSTHQLTLPVDYGIHVPWGLCLDESRGRLYVGEGAGSSRVLVFDAVRLPHETSSWNCTII